ncbi:MAG: hypothetical protein ABIG96_00780 [Candidatus Micrarchaeota archaeon]
MGFLEAIFGKKEKEPEKPAAMEFPKIRGEAQRELDSKMKIFYEEAPGDVERIWEKLAEIREVLEGFSKKPIKTENPQHENIAKQMKENFFVRLPKIIGNVRKPEGKEFRDYREFHSQIVQAMAQITKITSDNRYLLFFFKEEFEKLGGPVKDLVKLVDGMGEDLQEEGKKLDGFEALMKEVEAYEAEGKRISEAEGKIAKNRMEISQLEAQLEKSGKKGTEARKIELENAAADLRRASSAKRDTIASIILPLERIIRKYVKISAEKGNSKAAEAFLGDHMDALGKPGGMESLKIIAKEIDAMLSDGRLQEDAKDLHKHRESISRILSGELEESLAGLGGKEAEIGKIGGKIAENSREYANIARLEEKINGLKADIGNLEGDAAGSAGKKNLLLKEIENAYSEFSGKGITLVT